jgi:hypothetical protein
VVVGGRDGLEDARVLVGNLALRMPVAPSAVGAGVHPSTSPCYCKIRLGKIPAKTVPAPLVLYGAGGGPGMAQRSPPLPPSPPLSTCPGGCWGRRGSRWTSRARRPRPPCCTVGGSRRGSAEVDPVEHNPCAGVPDGDAAVAVSAGRGAAAAREGAPRGGQRTAVTKEASDEDDMGTRNGGHAAAKEGASMPGPGADAPARGAGGAAWNPPRVGLAMLAALGWRGWRSGVLLVRHASRPRRRRPGAHPRPAGAMASSFRHGVYLAATVVAYGAASASVLLMC